MGRVRGVGRLRPEKRAPGSRLATGLSFFIPHEKCFPTIEEKDVRGIARRKQAFAWVTGPKDYNYKHILKSGPSWETKRFVSKVFDIPGMGHHSAPAKALEDALSWAEGASKPPAH